MTRMPKKKKSRKKQFRKTVDQVPAVSSTIDGDYAPDATVGPDTPFDSRSAAIWEDADSTSAPEIGQEQETSSPFASTHWELLDKHLFSGRSLPFAGIIVVIAWILVQDNGAGRLEDWDSIFWTLLKCSIVLGLFSVLKAVQCLASKLRD